MFGLVLHEFAPNKEFLEALPDAQLSGLGANPSFWRRVLSSERSQSIGDPKFVENVRVLRPECGN
jgi:hypothetical protein